MKSYHLGRKKTVLITQLVSITGALCILFSKDVAIFYLGNFLLGYTNGVFLGIAPIYTGEINQPSVRKFTGSFLSLTFLLGYAITYLVGSISTWRIAASIQLGWPCVAFLLLLACPESPTWLLLEGKKDLAFETLLNLRGDALVAIKEMERIEKNLEHQKQWETYHNQQSFIAKQLEIVAKGTFVRPCFVITMLMSICWHWTGGVVFLLHTVDILKAFEVPISADWASAGIGWYQVIGAIVSIPISLVLPRRKFYIGSAICIFLGSFILGIIVHLKKYEFFLEALQNNPSLSWIPVIALLIYFAGYSTGYVSVCFMLLGELLPSNGREIGSFIAVESSNISAILLIKFLPQLKLLLGLDGLFLMFSGISVISIAFAYFCVPETFGKPLEKIEEHYRKICYNRRLENRYNLAKSIHTLSQFNKAFVSE